MEADRQKSQEGRFQHYIGKHSLATAAAQRWNEYPTRVFAPHPKRRPRASIQKQCDQSNGGVAWRLIQVSSISGSLLTLNSLIDTIGKSMEGLREGRRPRQEPRQ